MFMYWVNKPYSLQLLFFGENYGDKYSLPATSPDDSDCVSVPCRRNSNYEFVLTLPRYQRFLHCYYMPNCTIITFWVPLRLKKKIQLSSSIHCLRVLEDTPFSLSNRTYSTQKFINFQVVVLKGSHRH